MVFVLIRLGVSGMLAHTERRLGETGLVQCLVPDNSDLKIADLLPEKV